jgi:hypothetical protein
VLLQLAENERHDWERRLPKGRLDPRAVLRPVAASRPFRRRLQPDDRAYAFALLLDRSGSMIQSLEDAVSEPAFGAGPGARWQLTYVLGVAFTEALARLPETTTSVITYESDVVVIKRQLETLTPKVKARIIDAITPAGGNDDAAGLRAAIDQLASAPTPHRFLIHLTDGRFCSSAESIQDELSRARRLSIEVVILTLGIDADFARAFVPEYLAERVDEDTLIPVLTRHLKRMTGGLAAA